jgi:arginine decarboxylase
MRLVNWLEHSKECWIQFEKKKGNSSLLTNELARVNPMADEAWSLDKSRLVYGVKRNDLHFLDITEDGDLCLQLRDKSITFREIIGRIKQMNGESLGYASSFTLRVPQLVTYQIKKLKAAFQRTMEELEYDGKFIGIYPVKVNQRKDCVTAVLRSDSDYGLEAGTKAELLLIKKVIESEKHRPIVCNGAKDPKYLKLIRECIKEGYNIAISVESVHESRHIVEKFEPEETNLVLRIKPYLSVEGHWSHSTGRDSKFGLSIHDLYDVVELLRKTGFEKSVQTILAHAGSQITEIESFEKFGRLLTKLYAELREMGLSNLENIDFGGGLAIDYTSSEIADLMLRYAKLLVTGVKAQLSDMDHKHSAPNIMIESGRGITALSTMVVVEALEARSIFPPRSEGYISETIEDDEKKTLARIKKASTLKEIRDIWNTFHEKYGGLNLAGMKYIHDQEMVTGVLESAVREKLVELYLNSYETEGLARSFWHPEHIVIGNFSIFNSIADHVLVKQHFPVIPIQDLNVKPQTTIRLVDITCDSDGEIAQFYRPKTDKIWFTKDNRLLTTAGGKMGQGIPVGNLENVPGSCFVLGLAGAYQDAIEMDHNLLGDLPDVELYLSEDGKWVLSWLTGAESIEELLKDAGYADINVDEDPYMWD